MQVSRTWLWMKQMLFTMRNSETKERESLYVVDKVSSVVVGMASFPIEIPSVPIKSLFSGRFLACDNDGQWQRKFVHRRERERKNERRKQQGAWILAFSSSPENETRYPLCHENDDATCRSTHGWEGHDDEEASRETRASSNSSCSSPLFVLRLYTSMTDREIPRTASAAVWSWDAIEEKKAIEPTGKTRSLTN